MLCPDINNMLCSTMCTTCQGYTFSIQPVTYAPMYKSNLYITHIISYHLNISILNMTKHK